MDELSFRWLYLIFHQVLDIPQFHWRLPYSFQEETQFSSLCCLPSYLCTHICIYTHKWILIKYTFLQHIFLLSQWQTCNYQSINSQRVSVLNTMLVLLALHLPTAKSFFGNVKTEEKPKRATGCKVLLYLIFSYLSFFYWTPANNFAYRQGGDVDCLL